MRVSLMSLIIAASVVDLPEPVVPGDQHQPALGVGDLLQHRRQAELVEAGDLARDDPQHRAEVALLLEDVDAEAADPLDVVRGVVFLELAQVVVDAVAVAACG
jgi:hypothetical protein